MCFQVWTLFWNCQNWTNILADVLTPVEVQSIDQSFFVSCKLDTFKAVKLRAIIEFGQNKPYLRPWVWFLSFWGGESSKKFLESSENGLLLWALTSLFCSTSNRQCILSRKSGPTLEQPYRASLVCFKYPFHSSPSIVKGDKSCIDHRVIKEQPHLYASEHFAGLSSHITLSL